MSIYKNQELTIYIGLYNADGTENVTATPNVTVSKDGSTYELAENAPAHLKLGIVDTNRWAIVLTADEMNAGAVDVVATATGCRSWSATVYTEAAYTATRAACLDTNIGSRAAPGAAMALVADQDVRHVTGTVAAVTDVLAAIKGDGWSTQTLVTLKTAIDAKLNASAYTAPPSITDLPTKSDLTTARDTITTAITNKAVTPATDVSALATTVQLTSARDTITTAITNKAVTPATDTSSLPTKTDLSSTQTAITTAIANKVVEVELPPITIAPEDIATGIDASEKITRIDSQVALAVDRLTPAPELNINSRVNAGTIEIDRGDDYVSGDIPLPFTGRDLTSADSVKIHITKINRPNVDLLAVDTPVSNPGASNQTIQVVLSDAQTSALPVGFLRYEVKAVFGAESKTLFGGTLDVK